MLNKFVFTSEYLETVLYHRCAADQSVKLSVALISLRQVSVFERIGISL